MHALKIAMQALSTGTLMCSMYRTLVWLFLNVHILLCLIISKLRELVQTRTKRR